MVIHIFVCVLSQCAIVHSCIHAYSVPIWFFKIFLQSPWILVLDTNCCYKNRSNTGWIHLHNTCGDASFLELELLGYIVNVMCILVLWLV